MAKFKEAHARLFSNVFVCKKCKTKRRVSASKVIQGRVLCRRCGGKAFRAIKKSKSKA